MTVLDRFLHYVSYETTATEEKEDSCSNPLILRLTEELLKELQALSPDEISVNRYGIIDAKFHGDSSKPGIAFLAHMDTSSACSGKDVHPRIVEFDGKDVTLQPGMVLSMEEFPLLKESIGHHIIVTDGNTLLGGDDKAGIAIIMTALTSILEGKKNHRPLEIIFTTDEEIGADAEHVSMECVTSEYGYTIDGGDYRYVSIESFTAYSMKVSVKGKSIHPGAAYHKMVNASNVLMKFHGSLPETLRPEYTKDKEPFYHLCELKGSEDHADGDYIIRSFDEEEMKSLIALAKLTARKINEEVGYEAITLEFREQYHNMKAVLDRYPEIQKEFESVYQKLGIPCLYEAVRGGTTGSQLSFMGLPTPNLGTGDYNMHGRYEYVDLEQMEKMVEVVEELMKA